MDCTASVNDETTTISTILTTSSAFSTLPHGGFDYELLGGTDSRYECPICLLYMRDPVITSCGHRFCSACINQWVLNQTNTNGCPVDGGVLSHENIFPDNCTRREILACKVKCPYLKEGCAVILPMADMEKHVELEHTLPSYHSISTLKYNGNPGSSNGNVECMYKEVGCVNVFPPEQLQRHLETDVHHHLQLCTASYKRLKKIISRPVLDYQAQPDLFSRQDSRESTRWLLYDDMDSDEYNFRRQRSWDSVRFARRFNSRQNHYPDKLAESDESLAKTHYPTSSKEAGYSHSRQNLPPATSNGQENQLKDLFERLVRLEQNDREKQIKIDTLESKLASAVNLFSNVTCLMEDLTARYCLGVFVWKLTNFEQLCQDFRKNKSRILTSPGFYTNTFGYKLCLRFNLFTPTIAGAAAAVPLDVPLDLDDNHFVSLYVHFMQGEFDDTVQWPFRGELKFTIIHPTDPDASLTEAVKAKPEMAAFTKPKSSIHPKGIGYDDVCSLKKIFSNGFVKDDSLTVTILAKAF